MYSSKVIPEGKTITDYQGVFVLNVGDKLDTEHSTEEIDGTEVRGYSAFSNDCAPNAYLTRVPNAHGFPGLRVLASLRPIEKNEMICWNYLTHDIKKGAYVELEKERVDNFIKHYGSLSHALKFFLNTETKQNGLRGNSRLSKNAI